MESDPLAIARVREVLPSSFAIDLASDRQSVKTRLSESSYDLILIEPWQDGQDGLELKSWLLEIDLPKPFAILTSKRDFFSNAQLEEKGAVEFLQKSEDVYAHLANICRFLIRNYRVKTQDPVGLPNSLIVFDRDLVIRSFNSSAQVYIRELTGHELAVGLSARNYLIQEDITFLEDLIANARNDGKEQWTFPMPIWNGGLHWLEIDVNLLLGDDHQVSAICVLLQDLSLLKKTEDTLRQQEATLHALINATPGATFLITPDGTLLAANEAASVHFGRRHADFIGSNLFDLLPPEVAERRRNAVKQVIETRKPLEIIDFNMGKHLRSHLHPVMGDDGVPNRIAILALDITDQVRVEEAYNRRDAILQAVNFASEQFLQAASWRDRIPEVLKRWSEATNVQRAFIYQYVVPVNGEAYYELAYGWDTNLPSDEMVRNRFLQLSLKAIGLPNVEELLFRGEIVQDRLSTGSPEVIRVLQQNGAKALLHVPVIVDDHFWGFIGFTDCVVAREWSAVELDAIKTAANILSAALQRERDEMSRAALLDALPDLMFLYDRDGKHIDYHTQDSSLLAVPPEKFLGKTIEEVLPENVANLTRNALEEVILTGIPQHYEYYLPVGNSRDWEGRMVRSGEGVVAIVRDITERRRFEEELRQSEKAVSDLYEITSSSEKTFDEKQQALLQMGCQRFEMESGFILRLGGSAFEVAQIYSPNKIYERYANLPLDESFSREVIRSNQTLVLEDVVGTKWERHPAYRIHKLRSYIGAPLFVGGRLYGVLAFSSLQPHEHSFAQAEERFLHLMSQWIGLEREREENLGQLQNFTNEISRKNQELAIARDEALEVSRLKSEFLATMSHEIRTPMNAVIGMTELLLNSSLDSNQREYAETVQGSARLLLSLLNNVLDYSKIEAGKLILEQVIFDPQKVLDDAAAMFGLLAQQKKIEFNSFISPKIPQRLLGDPVRFSQVLINLIANAVRFTNHGSVMVWSEVLAEHTDSVELMIRVRDTGIGLSDGLKEKIFQPFTQGDGSTTRKYGGTGLGLTIAKRLVERMGGALSLESVEGVGSIFWFTVKFQRAGDEDLALVEKPKFTLQPGERVLVFESLADARHLWQRYLEDWKIPFELVESPKQVVDHLRSVTTGNRVYACCILDHEGLRRLGAKGCNYILDLARTNRSHLIMVTRLESRLNLQNMQSQEIIVKRLKRPFSRSAVESLLASMLQDEQTKSISVGKTHESHPPLVADQTPLMTKTVLLAEDNLANQHLAAVQLQNLGYRTVTVSTGVRAVDELAQHYPDYGLVLMDLQMPEMDGFEATRIIRKAEEFSGGHIPIVAMTASVMLEDQQQCLQAGMDDYISKPVLLDDLRKVFTRIFAPDQGARNDSPSIQNFLSDDQLLDDRILADLRSLNSKDEPDFFGQLVTIYLEDSNTLMQTIHSVADADEKDALRKAVHSLKGISSNLGGVQLANLCGLVENSLRSGMPLEDGWLAILERQYALTCEALKLESSKEYLDT